MIIIVSVFIAGAPEICYAGVGSLDYMAPAAFAAKCFEQGSAVLRLPQDKENTCGILS